MRRVVAGLGIAAAVTVMLAGCSSPAPEATPSSTTTTTTTTTTLVTPTSAPISTTNPPTTSTTVPSDTTVSTTTSTLPQSIGFLAQAASFATPAVGFVMGDVRCGTVTCLALRRTANGGATWAKATPPGPPSARNISEVTGLVFADGNDGWAYGPTLWATHNAAAGWTRVHIGGAVDAMATADGETYALVDPCQTLTCTGRDRLERSPVGEDAWTRMGGTNALFSRDEPQLAAAGSSVFVLSQMSGTTPAALATSVSGGTFTQLPIPCQTPPAGYGGPLSAVSLAVSSPNDVAVLCLGDPATESALKQVFVSTDGGHTFIRQADPPDNGGGASVALPDSSTVVLAVSGASDGVERLIAPSTTWAYSLSLPDGGVGLSNLHFIDPLHGSLIDGAAQTTLHELSLQNPAAPFGRLYLTDNGGASWRIAQIPA